MALGSSNALGERALFSSPDEKAALETRNGLLQLDAVNDLAREAIEKQLPLPITSHLLRHIQEFAIRDIYTCAGRFRTWGVQIQNSKHVPPLWTDVDAHIAEMCGHANDTGLEALHAAAYLMWRVNWIHPFGGGNGRTSRAIAYLALQLRLGRVLPGQPSIPEQIEEEPKPYYHALEIADATYAATGEADLTPMMTMIDRMLIIQLRSLEWRGRLQNESQRFIRRVKRCYSQLAFVFAKK